MANFIYDSAVQMRDNKNENDKEQDQRREEECSAVVAVQYSEYCNQTLKNQPRAGEKLNIHPYICYSYVALRSAAENRKRNSENSENRRENRVTHWQN